MKTAAKTFAKRALSAALLSGLAFGANAATYALGTALPASPLTFNGIILGSGPFSDVFTFSLPGNGGSTYSAVDIPIVFDPAPPIFKTIFSSVAVFSNPDGILYNGDDAFLLSSGAGGSSIGLSLGPTAAGNYYLTYSGVAAGTSGGLYKGTITVTPVPEPESYAMLLAGLGVMGAIAVRRNKAKKQD